MRILIPPKLEIKIVSLPCFIYKDKMMFVISEYLGREESIQQFYIRKFTQFKNSSYYYKQNTYGGKFIIFFHDAIQQDFPSKIDDKTNNARMIIRYAKLYEE